MGRRRLLVTLFLALLAPTAASAAGDPGTVERRAFATGPATTAHYLIYTPSTYRAGTPAPLLVMSHGCNTRAEQQAAANLYHPLAERFGFVVLYPDNDDGLHTLDCWRFSSPADMRRDSGDPSVVAGMTREVMGARRIDPERVFAMGMSSGGLMTSNLLAAYPDLYAAGGIMAGGPYGGSCFAAPTSTPERIADEAHAEMGERARIVPFLVLHGDRDATVDPACGEQALEQALRTANLVVSEGASQTAPIALTAAAARRGRVADGYDFDVSSFRDPDGCLIAERWTVRGMDHFWSGGTTDPEFAAFTDPRGPSAAQASWAFFSRYVKSDTSLPCAEITPDTLGPIVTIGSAAVDRRRALSFSGTAVDRAPATTRPEVTFVEIAVAERSGKLCRFLTGGPTTRRPCTRRRYLEAGRGSAWSVRLVRRLRPGTYVAWARAVDPAGNFGPLAERAFRIR